jgi:hypothetical protein
VVAFVRLYLLDNVMDACIAFERPGVKVHTAENVRNTRKAVLGIFQSDAPNKAVDFVTFFKK